MTLNEALAAKTRGLTKEQIIAQLRAVAEEQPSRRHSHNRAGLEGKTVKQSRNIGTAPFNRLHRTA
jgi:hypothetical protein